MFSIKKIHSNLLFFWIRLLGCNCSSTWSNLFTSFLVSFETISFSSLKTLIKIHFLLIKLLTITHKNLGEFCALIPNDTMLVARNTISSGRIVFSTSLVTPRPNAYRDANLGMMKTPQTMVKDRLISRGLNDATIGCERPIYKSVWTPQDSSW